MAVHLCMCVCKQRYYEMKPHQSPIKLSDIKAPMLDVNIVTENPCGNI